MTQNPSPISVLPNEILLDIFTRGIKIESQNFPIHPVLFRPPAQLVMDVASVCRSWRVLALSTPSLWTTVVACPKVNQRAQLFLERSFPCPISIHIYSTWLKEHDTVNIIEPHLSRLRSLTVRVSMPMEATAYTKAFSSLTAPRLEDFSIMITPSISVFSEQSEDLRIIRDVHMLQSLTVKGFPFPYDCASDWRNLTFLNVRGFQPAYTQFSQLFQSAPLLETVYLPTLRWVPDLAVNVKDVPVIEAPALKDLRVGLAGGHDDTRCECPLSLLLMPNLQSLAVIGDEHAYCSLAHHFSSEYVTNNFTKLTHLLLVCLSLTPRDVHFFRRLDNLRRLELDGVDGELSLNLAEGFRLGDSGEIKVPLPSLEFVTIFDAVEVDIGRLEKRASVQSSQLTIGMRDLPAELEATTSSLMKYKLIGEGPLYFPRDLSDPWNDGVFEPDDDDDFGDDEDDFEVYSDYDAFDDLDVEEDAFEYYNHEDGYEDYEDMEDLYAAI